MLARQLALGSAPRCGYLLFPLHRVKENFHEPIVF